MLFTHPVFCRRYRRIPGDKCEGGDEKLVVDAIKYIDTKIPCKTAEIDNYGFTLKDQQMMTHKKVKYFFMLMLSVF